MPLYSHFVPGLCVYRGDGSRTTRRPGGCTSSRPTRGLRPTALSVRPGGRRPLLRQMVHRPSGVLPLHTQRTTPAQGLPDPGTHRPRRTGCCVGNLANWIVLNSIALKSFVVEIRKRKLDNWPNSSIYWWQYWPEEGKSCFDSKRSQKLQSICMNKNISKSNPMKFYEQC